MWREARLAGPNSDRRINNCIFTLSYSFSASLLLGRAALRRHSPDSIGTAPRVLHGARATGARYSVNHTTHSHTETSAEALTLNTHGHMLLSHDGWRSRAQVRDNTHGTGTAQLYLMMCAPEWLT